MDDGYKHRKALYISTESFSLEDNEFLVKILKKKFDLDCSAHLTTNGYRVYIFSSSRERLKNLIHPYLLPHFYYKLDLAEPNQLGHGLAQGQGWSSLKNGFLLASHF
jgi:LAGLIDADG DNA endonuclease family